MKSRKSSTMAGGEMAKNNRGSVGAFGWHIERGRLNSASLAR